jgi:hypothetical protein
VYHACSVPIRATAASQVGELAPICSLDVKESILRRSESDNPVSSSCNALYISACQIVPYTVNYGAALLVMLRPRRLRLDPPWKDWDPGQYRGPGKYHIEIPVGNWISDEPRRTAKGCCLFRHT